MLSVNHAARAAFSACIVMLALLVPVSGAHATSVVGASAANPSADCGAVHPTGETPVSSYQALQTDLTSSTSASFYLTTSLADSPSTAGGLIPAGSNGDTINLNGCDLTISNAGAGNAGIDLASAALTIEDLSADHDGVLTAIGGGATTGVGTNGLDTETGGGAGIGSSGDPNASPPTPDALTILSGTVDATGGSNDTSSVDLGAGAGIGGAGSNADGGAGGNVTISGTASVDATGGTAPISAGAGIGGGGGGGGGDGTAAGDAINLAGGTIDATGGSTTSDYPAYPAGPGIGGGSIGNGASPIYDAAVLNSTGGSITATAGATAGSDYPNGISASDGISATANGLGVHFISGTTTVQASISGAITVEGATLDLTSNELDLYALQEAADGTINLAGDDALTLNAVGAGLALELDGSFMLPSSSSLLVESMNYDDDALVFDGTATLAGSVTAGQGGGIAAGPGGYVTLTTLTSPLIGTLAAQAGGTLVLPANATINPAGGLADSGSLVVPSSTTLDIDNPVGPAGGSATVNSGATIDLHGTLTGTGTLTNDGSIVLEPSSASIPGDGTGADGQLTIAGNAYDLIFNVPSPGAAPASQWLYAPTLADGNETLPAAPAIVGYADNGGWIVDGADTSPASAGYVTLTPTTVLDAPGDVYLAGNYQYSAVTVGQSETLGSGQALSDTATVGGGSYFGSPTGSVTFYACGPLASAIGCSASTGAEVDGPVALITGANDTSTASVTFTPGSPGVWCLYAAYSGDASNLPAGEGTSQNCETVTGSSSTGTAPTSVTKPVSSLNPSIGGEPIKLSTRVSSTSGVVESGEVAFLNGSGTTLCIAEVSSAGTAACDTSSAPVGTDRITAEYEGNAYFAASPASAALTQTVDPNSSFAIVSSSVDRATLHIKLELSDAGRVHIDALLGKRAVASMTRNERVKNDTRVSLTLPLAALHKREQGRRVSSRVNVLLRITFTPAGRRVAPETRTKLISLRVSQL